MRFAALLAAALAACAMAPARAEEEIEPGVWLVPGQVGRLGQPDGNSVVFRAPQGGIVFDTGRHAEHREAIRALLHEQDLALMVIVNSHWHLDHVSGNPGLKAAYPDAQSWSSDAIDGALSAFLACGAQESRAIIAEGKAGAVELEERRLDLATVEAGAALRPDHVVAASGPVELAGQRFELHLARGAATGGDVWLYDPETKLAVVGDLVTFPAPFLDTACPDGWKAVLGEVASTPFQRLVPGHGPVMDRAAFEAWRSAFTSFLDCAADAATPLERCGADWSAYVATVPLDTAGIDGGNAAAFAGYYGRLLRGGTLAANCPGDAQT